MRKATKSERVRTQSARKGAAQEHEPRMPHEHDQSADSQGNARGQGQQEVGKQAHTDIERGLVDTDRAPEVDRLYRRHLKR